MNRLLSTGLGVCLLCLLSGKALASQGLVLVIVVAIGPNGPMVSAFEPSAAFVDEVCGESASINREACDLVLDKRLVGGPAAATLARVFGAGLSQLVFEPANVVSGKPLLIVAEDVEGEAFAAPRTNAHGPLHLITMAGEDGVSLITCDFGTTNHEVVHIQQQSLSVESAKREISDERVRCVDAVQDGLFQGLTIISATPFVGFNPSREHSLVQPRSTPRPSPEKSRPVGVGFYLLRR